MLDLSQSQPLCTTCVKRYACKHRFSKGDPDMKFNISCMGIPNKYVSEECLAGLDMDEKVATAMLDPVTWAAVFLDWHCTDPDGAHWKRKHEAGTLGALPPYEEFQAKAGKSIFHRPYQAVMLRCTSKRKVFRIGRQAGKCLKSGTKIQMANGSLKPVESIRPGELIAAFDEDYNVVEAPAYLTDNGVKQVARLELMDGREVSASLNHPFLTRKNIGRETTGARRTIFRDEWLDLSDIGEGDYVAVPRRLPEGKEQSHVPEKLRVLGLMLADGNITGGNCRFSNQNEEILDHLRNSLTEFGCSLKHYDCDAEHDYHIIGSGIGKAHGLKSWLRELGLQGLNSHEKSIPDFVMTLNNKSLVPLLRAMYGCDGWASVDKNGKPEVGYCTVSEKMASQLVSVLARFGIYASTRLKVTRLEGKKFFSRQVVISRRDDIALFVEDIGLLGKDKAAVACKVAALARGPSPKTDAYEEADLVFVKVRSVVETGEAQTWDLTVPDHHTLVSDNIISHNTECLCIAILHALWTHEKFQVTVIAPYQSQIDLIFTRLEELIKANPMLQNDVERSVKAPNYKIILKNDSRVLGFTAGTRSGGDAASARGQSGGMLVFDEADYLSPADVNAALAIITNFPNASVWMSSTPTGRREKFYECCVSREWKEFHYSSSINPNWTEELERFYRDTFTEEGYEHEINADFSEQAAGVYQAKYVEAAQANFKYEDCVREREWHYAIGVDWNDTKIGVCIAVVGFNPADGIFKLVDKKIVSKSEYTQLKGCETVRNWNQLWRPFAIYIDRGFGATQEEILTLFGASQRAKEGKNHPDARLSHIVKAYEFGSSIEINDPFTKQPVKKHAKAFLVENSVRRFEQQNFFYPKADENYTKGLLGYIVKSVSIAGVPIYFEENEVAGDHFLDAVNLALVAFTLEKTEFGQPRYGTDVVFTEALGAHDSGIEKPEGRSNDLAFAPGGSPAGTRMAGMGQNDSILPQQKGMPGARLQVGAGQGCWNWPGFEYDRPRPKPRTTRQAFSEAAARVGGTSRRRRPAPPRRKKW